MRCIGLIHHQDIRQPRYGFARMVGRDLIRPECVGNADVQIGTDKRKVVVAAIPHKDVRFGLGRS